MARATNGGRDFVKVGWVYQYKEDWFIAKVRVNKDTSDKEAYRFNVTTLKANDDPISVTFDVMYTKLENGYFSGMSQFYKEDEYTVDYTRLNPLESERNRITTPNELSEAISTIRIHNKASATLLQRCMYIPFWKAADILDDMEKLKRVWPQVGAKPREIYFTKMDTNEDWVAG